MRNIFVLGGGISGCSIAYMLKMKGYDVTIIEKEKKVGGLCVTEEIKGISYEFGPHICYAAHGTAAYDIFHNLLPEFKSIKYFPKQSIDGEINNLATFPITVANVLKLPEEDKIRAIEELYHVNLEQPNYENFEEFIISRVGKTMYEYCFKNYNRKQWGIDPEKMDSEWAKFRNFYLRSGDYGMFGDLWQGHPSSYNNFFARLTKEVDIIMDEIIEIEYQGNHVSGIKTKHGDYKADIVVSTLPVDFIVNRKDELEYRGIMKLYYLLKGESGLPTYLCTFPNNYCWTRITDYTLQSQQNNPNSLISMAVPHSSKDRNLNHKEWEAEAEDFIRNKMQKKILEKRKINFDYVYPISSIEMLDKYNTIINQVSKIDNLISFGRLGLYSYISMCTAISQAEEVANNIEKIVLMGSEEKYIFYKKLREELK